MIVKYQVIERKQKIKGRCLKCGLRREITIRSGQTINPFNKNDDGTIKSYEQVLDSVNNNLILLIMRRKQKFICSKCFGLLPWGSRWFEKTEGDFIKEFKNLVEHR